MDIYADRKYFTDCQYKINYFKEYSNSEGVINQSDIVNPSEVTANSIKDIGSPFKIKLGANVYKYIHTINVVPTPSS